MASPAVSGENGQDGDRSGVPDGIRGEGGDAPPRDMTRYVLFCAACASLNSVILGFDIGVSGGAFFIARDVLGLTEVQTELVIGCLNACAVVGAILSREVSDRLGRCTTLAVGSGLFFLGSLTLASSSTFGMLLLGRALLGLGVGTGLSIDPLYISEISPPARRGFLVSWSEVSINLGIIAGFVSSYALSGLSPAVSWRLMVGLGAVLPVPMFLLSVFVMPESPRHLVRIGAGDRAARVLGRLVGADTHSPQVEAIMQDITRSLGHDRGANLSGLRDLFTSAPPAVRLMLTVVVTVAVAQHGSGAEAFTYYTPFILRDVGFQSSSQVLGITAAMGTVKTLTLVPVAWSLDREWGGRRRMLLVSYSGMALALLFLAHGVAEHNRTVLLAAIFGYQIMFAAGAGPICWLLASEVLPTDLRAKGMMLAVIPNRVVASVISLTFLSATSDSAASAFVAFSVFCLAVCIFVYYRCPETKGRSLEDMYVLFEAIARHQRRTSSRAMVARGPAAERERGHDGASGAAGTLLCCCQAWAQTNHQKYATLLAANPLVTGEMAVMECRLSRDSDDAAEFELGVVDGLDRRSHGDVDIAKQDGIEPLVR